MLLIQNFLTNVLENIGGTFDADFASQNWIFVFDGKDAFEIHVHVGLNNGFPDRGTMAVAYGAESVGSFFEFVFLGCEIEDAIFRAVFRKDDSVFHMRVEERALLAEEMNDFDRITTLPEEVAEVAVCADFLADGFAQVHQCTWIVNHEVGMHFERQALDAMGTRVFRGVPPIWNNLFLPLPL